MEGKSERKMIRPASNVERWQTALHSLGAYHGTTVACRYRIPRTLVDADRRGDLVGHFHHALSRTIIHHPFLRVGLAEHESKSPFWIELKQGIDLNRHVTWFDACEGNQGYDDLYQRTVQRFLNDKYTELESTPGFKIAVFRPQETRLEVVFGWNHTNCDGMGGKIFHRTLLGYLNDPKPAKEALPYDPATAILTATATAADLPPPQEDIATYTLSLTFLATTFWREVAYPWLTGDQSSKAAWSPIRTMPYETHRTTASLPATPLARVLQRCRERNTTLTGLLHGITLVFFAKLLGPHKAKAFTSHTPLDQRRHTPPNSRKHPSLVPDDTMANYVSIVMHRFPPATLDAIRSLPGGSTPDAESANALEGIIWTAAAGVRSEISARLEQGTKDDFTGLMRLIPDLRSFFKTEIEKPRLSTWLVSNCGVLDGGGGSEERWSIDRGVFSLSAYVQGPVCKLNVLSVKERELAVDVSWQSGVLEDEVGERLRRDIQGWLGRIGS